MESHRRPAGRRCLLPAEAELCQTVGLTEDEYWHFVDLTERYAAQRPEGYELIPDVRNDVVSVIVTLVIGIALQAISALLAPKPQEEKAPPSKKTADIKGKSRFAPQESFDSVQELANLGLVIPLVFTRKGVRVASQLLWSQMLSFGSGQQLRALMLFSSGEIEQRPDFAGFAIGDSLLENYVNSKVALYFKNNGGRISEDSADRYDEGTASSVSHGDAFSIFWEPEDGYLPYFSGTRTPGTSTQFGLYNPMPNGMAMRPDYELILSPADADSDLKEDISVKREKIWRTKFPRRCAIKSYDGQWLTYEIGPNQQNRGQFMPWGTEDIRSFTKSERFAVDEAIAVGETYMAGTALLAAIDVPFEPWRVGTAKTFGFRVIEPGAVDITNNSDTFAPYSVKTLQRVAIGTVSNNRACDCTELGIKSTVYRQVNGFPNVNSYPGEKTIEKYEKNNGSFQLGGMTKYLFRLSFFTLEVRPAGSNAPWRDISNGRLFCIKNNNPQPQYNYIRIHHPRNQYEFRFRPYAGNAAFEFYRNKNIWELRTGGLISYGIEQYFVTFSGYEVLLTEGVMSNPEWTLGEPPDPPVGTVVAVGASSVGNPPWAWNRVDTKYSHIKKPYFFWYKTPADRSEFWWNSELIANPKGVVTEIVRNEARYTRVQRKDGDFWSIAKFIKGFEAPTFTGRVAATGGSGSGLTFDVLVYSNGAASWSIAEPGIGYANGESVYIPQANATVAVVTDAQNLLQESLNRFDAVSDCALYSSERSSHDDSPEHEIVYVNEQLEQNIPQYDRLAYAGIRLNSSKEWTSFSSLTAFVKRGVMVERLTTSGRSATNLLPEIAYALLTDPLLGAGNLIGADQVNRERMMEAAKFCEANGFTWDGVVADRVNLRQWIYEQAGYCLLDFTILGGQFSLVPSVPYNTDYTIDPTAKPEIKALFTDGNIRALSVTFLSPEERQLFKAVVQWRQDKDNGFPQTRVVSMRLSDAEGGKDDDPEESFDMSAFCTSQDHAIQFAAYALRIRQKVDHGLKFETTPQAAMGLTPGDYFRLVSEITHTSRFQNGSIGPDGVVTCVGTLSASNPIIYWEPGTVGVKEEVLEVVNGRTEQSWLFGTVFTVKSATTTSRVYKVESISYSEEGMVEVAGSFTPLTDDGSLAVLDWDLNAFVVETD